MCYAHPPKHTHQSTPTKARHLAAVTARDRHTDAAMTCLRVAWRCCVAYGAAGSPDVGASWVEEALRTPLRLSCRSDGKQAHQRKQQQVLRSVALLLVHATRLLAASGAATSATSRDAPLDGALLDTPVADALGHWRGGGSRSLPAALLLERAANATGRQHDRFWADLPPPRHGVPLACLERDFMDANRELTLSTAGAAVASCDLTAVERSALLTARLRLRVHELQHDRCALSPPAAPGIAVRRGALRRQRASLGSRLIAVKPHPSGFFSLVHGMLKPLMFSVRTGRVLLTPRILEFTSEKFKDAPCTARDLSCFFEPLAPACDEAEREAGEQKARAGEQKARAASIGAAAQAEGGGRAGGGGKVWHAPAGGREWPVLPSRITFARNPEYLNGESRAARKLPPSEAGSALKSLITVELHCTEATRASCAIACPRRRSAASSAPLSTPASRVAWIASATLLISASVSFCSSSEKGAVLSCVRDEYTI